MADSVLTGPVLCSDAQSGVPGFGAIGARTVPVGRAGYSVRRHRPRSTRRGAGRESGSGGACREPGADLSGFTGDAGQPSAG
jgi:hypothetical protein